jgi:hypothetical protein
MSVAYPEERPENVAEASAGKAPSAALASAGRQVERRNDVTTFGREVLVAIRARLAELANEQRGAHRSGERAALWRTQHEAARRGRTLDDLRRYCLDALRHPQGLDAEDENDYLRGYRQGLQRVLSEIRQIEGHRRTDRG